MLKTILLFYHTEATIIPIPILKSCIIISCVLLYMYCSFLLSFFSRVFIVVVVAVVRYLTVFRPHCQSTTKYFGLGPTYKHYGIFISHPHVYVYKAIMCVVYGGLKEGRTAIHGIPFWCVLCVVYMRICVCGFPFLRFAIRELFQSERKQQWGNFA